MPNPNTLQVLAHPASDVDVHVYALQQKTGTLPENAKEAFAEAEKKKKESVDARHSRFHNVLLQAMNDPHSLSNLGVAQVKDESASQSGEDGPVEHPDKVLAIPSHFLKTLKGTPKSHRAETTRLPSEEEMCTPLQTTRELTELLEQLNTTWIARRTTLVVLDCHCTLLTALAQLAQYALLSAPVQEHNSKLIIGCVDVVDIVLELVAHLKNGVPDGKVDGITMHDVIKSQTQREETLGVYESDSLHCALNALTHGLHRLPVLNLNKEMVGMLSQSDLLSMFHLHPALIPRDKADHTVKDASLGTPAKECVVVQPNLPVYQVLELSRQHNTKYAVIVDPVCEYTGLAEFSFGHMRAVNQCTLTALTMPVFSYVKMVVEENDYIHTAPLSSTITELVHLMGRRNLHSVWIVDEEGRLFALVTLSDLLKYITSIM
eukprot:CAMPEP_0177640626 /NCGR_PEP_ID=MMETSP0447-20121125/6642_1 /TAXON_ID=0 /ORGANISM="Stygamoeba regulata, Strain BSH-02190019" /LENGTH=432 /DNA_ID=CAMNT_0019142707 /DNA_START=124 /DNA_END=1422 /DNA_ORIENTATION=-